MQIQSIFPKLNKSYVISKNARQMSFSIASISKFKLAKPILVFIAKILCRWVGQFTCVFVYVYCSISQSSTKSSLIHEIRNYNFIMCKPWHLATSAPRSMHFESIQFQFEAHFEKLRFLKSICLCPFLSDISAVLALFFVRILPFNKTIWSFFRRSIPRLLLTLSM